MHAGIWWHLLVIIEDDNHVLVQETSMVHSLIRHPSGDGTIPNDCNAVVLASLYAHHLMCHFVTRVLCVSP